MRRAWILLLMSACSGDAVGPDTATLCVEPALELRPSTRALALYHTEGAGQIVADAPVIDGAACLALRPPSAALLALISPDPAVLEAGVHPLAFPGLRARASQGGGTLRLSGLLIDVAVYDDVDGDGGFTPGVDAMRSRLSRSDATPLPAWVGDLDLHVRVRDPAELSGLFERLAPGNRPFTTTAPIRARRAFGLEIEASADRWQPTLVVPPTSAGTACLRGVGYPRCLELRDTESHAGARLIDPRVPAEDLRVSTEGFDPAVPLPPADAPVPSEVLARDCADVGPYRVARETTRVPRVVEDACDCEVFVRTRWVIGLVDDPPEWLTCGGRPLDAEAARALAVEAGLASP